MVLPFPLTDRQPDRQTDRQSLSVVLKQESSCLQNKHYLWETFYSINKPEVFFCWPLDLLLEPNPPESPGFCVGNLSSDGVGGAVTRLLWLITIFKRRNLITSCFWRKSHVLRVRNHSKRTRRVPDDTSVTRGFTTIRGSRSSCRHVDDVSAFLCPEPIFLPINASSSNRPRPSRLSTWGRANQQRG